MKYIREMEEVYVVLSVMRFGLLLVFIYVYFKIAEWTWSAFMPALSGAGVLLLSVIVIFFCVVFAQMTVWKLSEMFMREKYYE